MQRLNQAGHKAELHNNQGIMKEDMHYIIDVPQIDELKTKAENLVKEMPGMMPGSQMQGLLTHKQHTASVGEWQKQISTASLFSYFSMTCLLHQFPGQLITDLSILSSCKAMVIFDRMNTFKTLVDRQNLTSKHYQADEQPSQIIALMTLAGVNSIVINNWSTTPEDNLKQYEHVMKSVLQDGNYLGTYGLRKHFKN